ncbi:MAG: ATP-binding protein [Glaciecola sp.]|nr:ATP-binding protein [Glaciecola sp.]
MRSTHHYFNIFTAPRRAPLLYAIISGLLAISMISVIIIALEQQSREHIERLTQSTANSVAVLIQDELELGQHRSINDAFDAIPAHLKFDHEFIVSIDGQVIYASVAPDNQIIPQANDWQYTVSFLINQQLWQVLSQPKVDWLYRSHYRIFGILVLLGLLVSVTVALATLTALSVISETRVFKDERNKNRHLLNILPGMAYQAHNSPDWPMIAVNDGCEALTGYSRQTLINGEMLWGKIIHPNDYEYVIQRVNTAVEQQSIFELEYRIITHDNQTKLVWERGEAVYSVVHQCLILEGFITDISQQRVAEDQMREHVEHMAYIDRLNSLGEMAAGIAHEINQPLAAISLFSQSGKHLCQNEQYARLPDVFDQLSTHSRRAGAVLERMQMMTHQGERLKQVVDCNSVITDVIKLIEADARIRQVIITRVDCAALKHIYVDVVQIQQVLLNLLRNGMEAMQTHLFSHGNTIEISTELQQANESGALIKFAVKDTGGGVGKDMQATLFDAFSSTKPNGMGIGLSISKTIIEAHGGRLQYKDYPPFGSEFYFTLPVVE